MSGYEAKPDEDPVTIRGTSFDGIWDTVPIDSDISIGSAKRERVGSGPPGPDVAPQACQIEVKENKVVVRLPTPRASPLPSLAGSEHVASPTIQSATLPALVSEVSLIVSRITISDREDLSTIFTLSGSPRRPVVGRRSFQSDQQHARSCDKQPGRTSTRANNRISEV